MYQFILFSGLLALLIACRGKKAEGQVATDLFPREITMRVNYYQKDCQGEGSFTCLLVQEDKQIGTEEWTLFYEPIHGFKYLPGFIYTLKVKVNKLPDPPTDGSDKRYILIKILSKKKINGLKSAGN